MEIKLGGVELDKILLLLKKYDCNFKDRNKTCIDFLRKNYSEYIEDVKVSLAPEDNQLVGIEMCKMVSELLKDIEKNSELLIDVLELYNNGRIKNASEKAFEVFNKMKPKLMYRYSSVQYNEIYYRIRKIDEENIFSLERRELFHIPNDCKHLVGTERYSMPGHPCLYLASQPELCWYECGMPDKFAISKFEISKSENGNIKFIDFSEKLIPLAYSFLSWFHNNKKDIELIRQYLLMYIYSYPLRAACSMLVKYQGAKFIEEYIIPQLLLQWVVEDNYFYGIAYESCNSNNEAKYFGGYNIVLATKKYDSYGFDINLRENTKISEPILFDINNIKVDPKLMKNLNVDNIKEEPTLWRLREIIPNNLEYT